MGRKALPGLWEQLSFLLSKTCKCQSLCRENWVTSQWELEAVWVEDFVRNCQERLKLRICSKQEVKLKTR